MEHLLTATDSLMRKLSPLTRFIDSLASRLLPSSAAQACTGYWLCDTACGAYCNHFGDQLLIKYLCGRGPNDVCCEFQQYSCVTQSCAC